VREERRNYDREESTLMLKLADNLKLPTDEAISQKYGFIGRSGSGKSYAAMRLAELFLDAGGQIIALDWVGIWWSLRLAANGKDVGFPNVYIFGGEHADVDLRPESGALMADLVVDKHISVVLDVMHFRKAERTRFATAFAEQFFHRKKTARTACHLFIEEAQAYLPQMVRGDEARMVGVFEDIGKVGRNYGIGNSLISQRPQAINKDVLNQVEVLLAFQTNGPQERKAIAGWTAENTNAGAAMIQELPKLEVGHALVWSPQWLRVAERVHISTRTTYDASSTPTARAKAIRPKTLAKTDLEQLGAQISATIEKAKAEDPRELRKQIAELQKQIKSTAAHIPASNTPAAKALSDADRAALEKFGERFEQLYGALTRNITIDVDAIAAAVTKRVRDIGTEIWNTQSEGRDKFLKLVETKQFVTLLEKLPNAKAVVHAHGLPRGIAVPRAPSRPDGPGTGNAASVGRSVTPAAHRSHAGGSSATAPASDGHLPPGEKATLIAAAQYPEGLTREQASILTGYKRSSRDAYIQRLQGKGYLHPGGGNIVVTQQGVDALGSDYEPLPTGEDLQTYWLERLPPGEKAVLEVAIKKYPEQIDVEFVDEQTGYKRSSRDAYIQRLMARKLLTRGRGMIRASDVLFEG
jgi:hypothetical protein